MLRHNDTVRLTATESASYKALVGTSVAPKTVQDYNAGLASAAQAFAQGESAEEQLAAMLAQDLMVN